MDLRYACYILIFKYLARKKLSHIELTNYVLLLTLLIVGVGDWQWYARISQVCSFLLIIHLKFKFKFIKCYMSHDFSHESCLIRIKPCEKFLRNAAGKGHLRPTCMCCIMSLLRKSSRAKKPSEKIKDNSEVLGIQPEESNNSESWLFL